MTDPTERERIIEQIEKFSSELGLQVVEVSVKSTRAPLVEVFVDRSGGGVTTADCAGLNGLIRSFIEKEGLLTAGFTLEVSSPGLDRELKSAREFAWAEGRTVVANLHGPLNGKNVISGKFVEILPDGKLAIELDGPERVEIDRSQVAKVKLKA